MRKRRWCRTPPTSSGEWAPVPRRGRRAEAGVVGAARGGRRGRRHVADGFHGRTELRPFLLIGPMGVCVSASAGAAGQGWGRPRRADGRQGFDCLVDPGYRSSGVFAISRSTTATSPSGMSGASSASGAGCLIWWAIIFSTALPSGNGTRPVRQ